MNDFLTAAQAELVGQAESGEATAAAGDRFTFKVRDWTLTSKPILFWAIIVGVGSLVVAIGPGLVLTALGVTQKQLDNNPDLEGTLGWATLLLSIALPAVGGWRATLREGKWFQGGMAGFWGTVIFTLLLLIYLMISAAVLNEFNQINGNLFADLFLQYIVFQGILNFGLGAMGGWYSVWQRRRKQQAQEMLATSS